MEERNKIIFHINYQNKSYSISTSLTRDKINFVCQDPNSQIYENNFTLQELLTISKYFHPNHTLENIQTYINGIIERHRIGINQAEEAMSMILFLINNDQISIPLLKKFNPGLINIDTNVRYPYVKYNSMTHTTHSNKLKENKPNLNLIQQNPLNPPLIYSQNVRTITKSMPGKVPQQIVNNNNIEQKNINNIIITEKDKEIKNLQEEIKKIKEENMVFKTDHNSLTNENSILKNENDNYKKQILLLQNENKNLKEEILKLNQKIVVFNKDMDAVENQNDQIRKMYTELENELNEYKNRNMNEEGNKENEILRNQIEELNNNFLMINKELDIIRNENEIFKNNLEQQKQNLNEDVVNKLIEENNILKGKFEENEFLKKKIEELQYQLQYQGQEKANNQENMNMNNNMNSQINNDSNDNMNENEENNNNEEIEEKGEIIHNMKELELITNKINREQKKITINLLYKASVDGDKSSIFHEKCDQAQSTIVLVETDKGKRFGGFTKQSWAGNCEDKNDSDAFIFSLDKMETYDNIPGDEAIGCYPKFGPIFLGCQIKIFDNALTKGGTTFEKELNFNTKEDYELTGGERVFQIKDVEVYEVIFE